MLQREFVSLDSPTARQNPAGFHPCQGLLHTDPSAGPTGPAGLTNTANTAIIATHYNVDFSEHYLGPLMAARGVDFLGWNTRYRGNEPFFILEQALVDIGVGVRFLRERGYERVVLLGNSGGGSLMGAYQSQATDPNITPTRGMRLPEEVLDLAPADLYVSLNAHAGRPEVLTAWFDPSVVDESDPFAADPDLDLFQQPLPLDPAFVARYRDAQIARNHRITRWAIDQLDTLRGRGFSDRAFNLYRTWADPRMVDATLDPSDRTPGVCYAGDPKRANYSPAGIGLTNTLRTWLSMWSLAESQCRGAPHLARINVPALVIQFTADTGVFPSDAEAIFDALGSAEKTRHLIPGDHYLQTPEDARDSVADRIAAWIAEN
jgi:pimeloyl-ACP methyl ester carboxylesterase